MTDKKRKIEKPLEKGCDNEDCNFLLEIEIGKVPNRKTAIAQIREVMQEYDPEQADKDMLHVLSLAAMVEHQHLYGLSQAMGEVACHMCKANAALTSRVKFLEDLCLDNVKEEDDGE